MQKAWVTASLTPPPLCYLSPQGYHPEIFQGKTPIFSFPRPGSEIQPMGMLQGWSEGAKHTSQTLLGSMTAVRGAVPAQSPEV